MSDCPQSTRQTLPSVVPLLSPLTARGRSVVTSVLIKLNPAPVEVSGSLSTDECQLDLASNG